MNSDFVKAAILGHPVSHSKSPLIHNYWLKKYNINGAYEAIDVSPGDLPVLLQKLAKENYVGFNITLPHKETMFHLCDGIDALARAIGAVNLVSIENGRLMGSNSDAFGFIGAIKAEKPDFDFKAGRTILLGAGGATRAILHGLLSENVPEIYLLNRTREKAEMMAGQCIDPARVKIMPWEQKDTAIENANLLVNTTALGMKSQSPLSINLDRLSTQTLVADIVYQPLQTDLLRAAQQRGNDTIGGIGMLLHQARPAFQAWFGIMPEIDAQLERLVGA